MPDPIVLLVERDQWQRDLWLQEILLEHFRRLDVRVIWEDPAGSLIHRLRLWERERGWIPRWVRVLNLRAFQLAYGLCHWRYFAHLRYSNSQDVVRRAVAMERRIRFLAARHEIFVLSRSAGGRVASRIVDRLPVRHLVCLGYPFRKPGEEEDPGRFEHLGALRTPMTIFQGSRDPYGGEEIVGRYPLSPSIQLHFVEGDHSFTLRAQELEQVLETIGRIVRPDLAGV